MKKLLLAFLIGCEEPAPKTVEPLVIGDRFTIDSKILGEKRAINVFRPEPCMKEACPVLYMPDGGLNEDFPHVIGLGEERDDASVHRRGHSEHGASS